MAFVTNIVVISGVNEFDNTLSTFTKPLFLFLLLFIVFNITVKDERGV